MHLNPFTLIPSQHEGELRLKQLSIMRNIGPLETTFETIPDGRFLCRCKKALDVVQDPATVAGVGFIKSLKKFLPEFITTCENSDFFVSKAHHILADKFTIFTDLQTARNAVICRCLMAKFFI